MAFTALVKIWLFVPPLLNCSLLPASLQLLASSLLAFGISKILPKNQVMIDVRGGGFLPNTIRRQNFCQIFNFLPQFSFTFIITGPSHDFSFTSKLHQMFSIFGVFQTFQEEKSESNKQKIFDSLCFEVQKFFLRLNMASSGHRGNIREVVQENGSHHTGFCNVLTGTVRKELYEESCMNIDSRPGARVKRRFLCVSY